METILHRKLCDIDNVTMTLPTMFIAEYLKYMLNKPNSSYVLAVYLNRISVQNFM